MTPSASSKPARGASGLAVWARVHRARLIWATSVVAGVLAGAGLVAYLQPHTWRYYTDGTTVRRLAHDTAPRPVLWEDARAVPCNTNWPADASEPFVLADGITLLFSSGGASGNANLYSSRWNGQEWAVPIPL
ncbi:MAG: hypothetical protein WCK89_06520, partial [bacterium]